MVVTDNARFGEPALNELLSDPITQMLMQHDGVRPDDVRAVIDQAKHRNGRYPMDSPLCRISRLCEGTLPILGSITERTRSWEIGSCHEQATPRPSRP